MREKFFSKVFCLYALGMLSLLIGCVLTINIKKYSTEYVSTTTEASTEIIYVYINDESEMTEATSEDTLSFFRIQKHEEKIGIFSEDGILLEQWDVYVKTLPKADQRLLEEGFILYSETDLSALREDYTS